MTFDYELPVELFTAKRGARSRLGYRRFATAAEASIVVGDFPALRTLGARTQSETRATTAKTSGACTGVAIILSVAELVDDDPLLPPQDQN